MGPGLGPIAEPFVEVVAQEDGTTVTINPVADIVAGPGVAAGPKGTATKYSIDKGQVLQFTQDAARLLQAQHRGQVGGLHPRQHERATALSRPFPRRSYPS